MRFFFFIAFSLYLVFHEGSCQSISSERECQCILNNLWLDIYLLIDDSTNMGSTGLLEVASNVNSVFGYSQIRVGSNYPDGRGTRVSVITYNTFATIRANLSDLNSADELTTMVYSLKPSDSSTSNLQAPLKLVELMMNYKDQNALRNNTRSLIVIYAGDYHDVGKPTIAELGDELKANLVKIVTVADISRNDRQQIEQLKMLASDNDGFNINDDYVSEEVQQAMCKANCFCPRMFYQFETTINGTTHSYGTCVRFSIREMSWTNAKFFCQNLHKKSHLATEFSREKHLFNQNLFESLASQPEPYKYHIGLHYINNGYFWEQPDGFSLTPLINPLFPVDTKPASTLQCIKTLENMDTKELMWKNENCYSEMMSSMCEVPACDTENYCS